MKIHPDFDSSMLEWPTIPVPENSLSDGPALRSGSYAFSVARKPVGGSENSQAVFDHEEQEWILGPWYRRIIPIYASCNLPRASICPAWGALASIPNYLPTNRPLGNL